MAIGLTQGWDFSGACVCFVLFVVVLRLLVGAIFAFFITLERWQTLAFPPELVDAFDAVRVVVPRLFERRCAPRNRRVERSVFAAFAWRRDVGFGRRLS